VHQIARMHHNDQNTLAISSHILRFLHAFSGTLTKSLHPDIFGTNPLRFSSKPKMRDNSDNVVSRPTV